MLHFIHEYIQMCTVEKQLGKDVYITKNVNNICMSWFDIDVMWKSLQKCSQCWYFIIDHWNPSCYQYNYGIAVYFVKYLQYPKKKR